MAVDAEFPPRQAFTTSRKVTLSYVYVRPQPGKKTLLFSHGAFSHLYDWYYQITHFLSRGYGVLAYDHYGFGETSKPENSDQVRVPGMAQDLNELLDHLEIQTAVGITHDWAGFLMSRHPAYYPGRIEALIFLTFPPMPPGSFIDPEVFNVLHSEGFDYLSYIPWLATAPETQETLEKNAESFLSLIYAADPLTLYKAFHTKGTFEEFMKKGETCEIGAWYPEHMRQRTRELLAMPGGFSGLLEMHRMFITNMAQNGEEDLEDWMFEEPVLIIIQSEPEVAAEQYEEITREWAPNLTCVKMDVGFWGHLEKKDETNKAIEDFLEAMPGAS